nr:LysM peptidoglycan-binding domain-containing protein [Micromonospora purpureochromogenes]
MFAFLAATARRLAGLALLVLLTAGVPYALVRYVGWPLPRQVPTWRDIGTALTSPLTDTMLGNAIVCLLWLAWAAFIWSLIAEVAEAAAGIRLPQPAAIAPARGLAALLVAAVTGGVLATAAQAAPTQAAEATGHSVSATAPAAATTVSASAPPPAVADIHMPHTAQAANLARQASTRAGTEESVSTRLAAGHLTLVSSGQTYTCVVKRGDTLSEIAEQWLGDANRWPEIFALNRGTHFRDVGGTLTNPNLIYPGWTLELPDDATPPADAQPRTSPPADPDSTGSEQPAPTQQNRSATAPAVSPSLSPTAQPSAPAATPHATPTTPSPTATSASSPARGDDGVFVPPAATATASPTSGAAGPATPTTAPSPSTERTSATAPPPGVAGDKPSNSAPGWVEITGGAMGAGLATGLIYAVGMVWKRRRHRYRPTPITSPVLRDPDLTPPLAALTRLRQGVRRAAPHLLDRKPDRGPTVREYVTAEVKPALPPSGPSGAELAGVGTLPVTAGLGLDGPAALDAARALLVATLTSGGADDPAAQGRVIIPASTLATLLGVAAVDLDPMQRLTVAPTFAGALTLLEEEIIRRSRVIADQEAATVAALREDWTFGEPLPQLLLIADVPDQSWHTRLATAIRLGKNVDIGTALIGVWPEGTTLTVAADGTTRGGDGEHVAVLDATATTDILTMLAEAHGDAEPPAAAHAAVTTKPARPTQQSGQAPHTEPHNLASPLRSADTRPESATVPTDTPDAAADKRVHARVLGQPAILDADGKPVRGLRAKSLELFVYLVVHRSGANLDDIMEAIWPDVTVSRAADRLSTCVANLRTTIRSVAQTGTEPSDDAPKIEPVINTGGRYHLDPNLLQVDWWTVQDAYARVATAADGNARLAHLRTAIAAIGGGLADGCGYEWIDTDREHARRRLVKIYAHAAGLQSDSDPVAALALYDTARALDPLSDELARRAMRTAARLGDATGVRERLTTLRRELDDVGIDIDPDTEELATSLLRDLANP